VGMRWGRYAFKAYRVMLDLHFESTPDVLFRVGSHHLANSQRVSECRKICFFASSLFFIREPPE